MPRVITDGKTSIGAYKLSDRKKVALCIEEGNTVTVYGYFQSTEGAKAFMDKLGDLVHARDDGGADNG